MCPPLTPPKPLQPHRQRGSIIVELALVLVPLLIIGFGTVEYGRAMYQYDALVKATRSAARLLAQNNPSDDVYPILKQRALCLTVYGNTGCTGDPLAPGLSTADVLVCDRVDSSGCSGSFGNVQTGQGVINLVEVAISGYQLTLLGLPFVSATAILPFGAIQSTMRQVA